MLVAGAEKRGMMKQRLLAVLTIVTLLTLTVTAAGAADSPAVGTYDPEKQYIVGCRESGQLLSEDDSEVPFAVVSGDELRTLLEDGAVEWYEEDYEVTLLGDFDEIQEKAAAEQIQLLAESGGKLTENRWDLSMIQAELAHRVGCLGQGVRVGVIDSGIKVDHADLAGNVLEGYNYVDENTDTSDTLGHGTFVSGVIAALDDESGMVGIAPRAQLIPLKCFAGKTTSISCICRAIYGAVDDFDCDVINLSLGFAEDSRALETAVDYAAGKGVIMVAAAGNYSGETLYYPAAYDSVIGVGAVNEQGIVSSSSQHNSSVFLTAPGVDIKSTGISGGYVCGSGTSYAVPYVTAAVAVMKSVWGELSPRQAMDVLSASASDRGAPGYDPYYGYGIVNLQGCLKMLMQGVAYYISPVEHSGTTLTAVVYNNTDVWLSGKLVTSSHNGSVQKGLSTKILNLAAGGTRQIEVPSGQYTIRLFVWNSLSNDMILSNTRTVPMGLWPEDDSSLLRVAVGLTDCSGQEFSLAASAGEETVYAIQRSVPENGVYEMLIPRASVAVEPDRAEYAWDSPLTVMVNGSKRVIKAHTHTYGAPTEWINEDSGEHDTAYICTLCGCVVQALPEPPAEVPTPPENPPEPPKNPPTPSGEGPTPSEDTPEPPIAFEDVSEGDWYFSSVQFVYGKGLMRGVSDTQFAPKKTLNRGMFVTVLYRMAGEPETDTVSALSDVPADAYYARAVQWAYANGIVKGVSDTEFQPSREIRRQEIALMAYRYAAYTGHQMDARTELTYRDAGDIPDFVLDAVRWAAAEGIIVGNDQERFCPRDAATRAGAAAICMRLYQKTS